MAQRLQLHGAWATALRVLTAVRNILSSVFCRLSRAPGLCLASFIEAEGRGHPTIARGVRYLHAHWHRHCAAKLRDGTRLPASIPLCQACSGPRPVCRRFIYRWLRYHHMHSIEPNAKFTATASLYSVASLRLKLHCLGGRHERGAPYQAQAHSWIHLLTLHLHLDHSAAIAPQI